MAGSYPTLTGPQMHSLSTASSYWLCRRLTPVKKEGEGRREGGRVGRRERGREERVREREGEGGRGREREGERRRKGERGGER